MKYRADIDGLRALAVGVVVLSHLQVPGFNGGFSGVDVFFVISGFLITTYLVEKLSQGSLSLREFYFRRAKRILPMALLVLVITVGASFYFLNGVKATQVATDSFWSAIFLENLHLIQQSADYFNHGFAVSPVQHYWSLAVEEQFYLVFPLLLILFSKFLRKASKRGWLVSVAALVASLSAASLVLAISQGAGASSGSYFSSGTRAYEIGLGALLALAMLGAKVTLKRVWANVSGLVGLGAIAASSLLLNGSQGFPGALALLPTLGTALLIAAGSSVQSSVVSRFLAWKPLVFVGKISFSVYLIHWPLIVFGQQLLPELASSWAFAPVVLVATFALSVLAYALIERPTRQIQLKPRSKKPLVRLVFSSLAAVLAIGLASSAWAITGGTWNTAQTLVSAPVDSGMYVPNDPTPSVLPTEKPSPTSTPTTSPTGGPTPTATPKPTKDPKPPTPVVEASLADLLKVWSPKVLDGLALTKVPDDLTPPIASLLGGRGVQWARCMDPAVHQTTCEYGPANAKHTAVILGDSYALAVYPMVISALGLTDWKIIGLNQRECMVADITPWSWSDTGADPTCPAHRAWVNGYIARLKPDLIVLSDQPFHPIADGNQNSGDQHDRLWQEGLDSALAALRPLGKKIVYFGVPTSQQALTDCVLAGGVITPQCTGSSDWLSSYVNTQENLSLRYQIPYINANDWLCSRGKCPGIIDKTPVYWDGAHFTEAFAAKLGPLFRAFLIKNNLI